MTQSHQLYMSHPIPQDWHVTTAKIIPKKDTHHPIFELSQDLQIVVFTQQYTQITSKDHAKQGIQ